MSVQNDPRWQRLNGASYRCSCCNKSVHGMFAIAYDHPDDWPHGHRGASGEATLRNGEDALNADLCAIGKRRFIRCVLQIPIIGADASFDYGPWAEVTKDDFMAYVTAWHHDDYSNLPSLKGCLANRLSGLENRLGSEVTLDTGDGSKRPLLLAAGGAVASAQTCGIGLDRLLDLSAAGGMDLRPHLEG